MLHCCVRRKNNNGFTLIEMLTAVIIVGVLASIAAPNFLGLLNQTRIKEGLSQVEGTIKESQRLALRRGKTCKIRFTTIGTGSNEKAIAQVRPDETISGKTVSYNGCLFSTRDFDSEISIQFDDGTTVTPINSTSTKKFVDIVSSGKGTISTTGTIIISRSGTDLQKCLQIEGVLGTIITGDYDSSATQKCQAK